jgi:hypothetical protein
VRTVLHHRHGRSVPAQTNAVSPVLIYLRLYLYIKYWNN